MHNQNLEMKNLFLVLVKVRGYQMQNLTFPLRKINTGRMETCEVQFFL